LSKWPEQYFTALHPRTIDDALKSITPELSFFRKQTGELVLCAVLTLLIDDLLNFFSIGKSMGERQMAETVRMIIDDFYYLNFDDLKLCFNNAKKEKYGKIYDRIDGNIIYSWVQKYSNERVETVYSEMYHTPRAYDEYERTILKKDEDFDKFRMSYIVEKMNKNENNILKK
jgi:hypothetical protein